MAIKVKCGEDISVLESGTVIQFNQEPFQFQLSWQDWTQIFIEIQFITNREDTQTLIQFTEWWTNKLIINLINFENKINHGNVDPMRIWSLDSKELFFSFRITSAHENFSRTLEYTFYLWKNIEND